MHLVLEAFSPWWTDCLLDLPVITMSVIMPKCGEIGSRSAALFNLVLYIFRFKIWAAVVCWYYLLHGWYLCLQRIGDSGCTFVFVYEVFSLLDLCLERAREKNQRLISTLDPIIKIDDNCEILFFFGTFRVRTAFTMGTWKLQWCFWRWLVKLFSVLKDLVTVGSIWSLGRPLSAQCDEPSDHASVLDSCLKCGLAFLNTRTWFSAGFCLQAGFRDFQCEYKNVLAPCFRFGHLICVVWLLLCSENGE